MADDWMLMAHGLFNGVYDKQGGPRGGEKAFAGGMLMGMAQREIGDGTVGFKAMLSPDPFMGRSGYPLLLATGETADGVNPLLDRSTLTICSWSWPAATVTISRRPPASTSMVACQASRRSDHRLSCIAPAGWTSPKHRSHIIGSTAPTSLMGWSPSGQFSISGNWRGQHSKDESQIRIASTSSALVLNSFSGRLSWNPTTDLSMQVSYGHLKSPEQLSPDVNENRVTASIIYTTKPWDDALWSSTFAWGRKINLPGNTLDGFMLESALILKNTWTFFLRAEHVQEDELFDVHIDDKSSTAHSKKPIFTVNKVSAGAIYDFQVADHLKVGIGGLVSKYAIPSGLLPSYGRDPTSFMAFMRLKLI